MTSKKALEKIKNIELHHIECEMDDYCNDGSYDLYEVREGTIEGNYPEEIKTIEKDLEEYEKLKFKIELCTWPIFIQEVALNDSKRLKALEIIKDKRVDVRAFLKSCDRIDDGLLTYNNQCDNKILGECKELTQKEYDLLREVLL